MALAALLCVWLPGYLQGDVVSLLRRVQHSGQRTDWAEVPTKLAPRFLREKTVTLKHVPADHPAHEPYKMSLAVDGLRHTTPWITVADGRGRFLSHIELQLTAAGDTVSAVRSDLRSVSRRTSLNRHPHHISPSAAYTHARYVDDDLPAHITLRMVWMDATEHDVASALGGLFFGGAAIAMLVLWGTCSQYSHALSSPAQPH